jgi:hypothetical protein
MLPSVVGDNADASQFASANQLSRNRVPNIRASAFNGRLNLSMTLDQIYNHFGRDDVRDRFFEGQHPVPSCFT